MSYNSNHSPAPFSPSRSKGVRRDDDGRTRFPTFRQAHSERTGLKPEWQLNKALRGTVQAQMVEFLNNSEGEIKQEEKDKFIELFMVNYYSDLLTPQKKEGGTDPNAQDPRNGEMMKRRKSIQEVINNYYELAWRMYKAGFRAKNRQENSGEDTGDSYDGR